MTTSQSESATREAAAALTGVETTARSIADAAVEPASGITGAQSLVRSLEAIGVDVVFGIPGGAILPLYDPLFDSKVRHVLVRHEQGAGHAATGYAQATGRVGVCMATSGPGATNLVTPLADAYMDSVPMVAITGQVPSGSIGTDAFQEADIRGITMPITKHNFLVTDAADIPQRIAEAFHLASTGRPGPVLVDVPKDVLQATTDFVWPPRIDLPGYRPTTRPHGKQVREAAAMIAGASRPVLYVGGGVLKAGATEELAELAALTGAPVVTTLMARGAFPDSSPQHLGMPGMHGTVAAVTALQKSDVLVALGARFDDRVTGQLATFAPDALVVHADIDPAEIGKNRKADVPIVGDAKETIGQLVTALRAEHEAGSSSTTGATATRWATTSPRTARCRRSTSSSGSARSPAPTRSTPPAWASTRCGPRSSSSTRSPAPGSTAVAWGRWATRCPPPWAPSRACPTPRCGRSTATAASR
jgi:acetolactate synthase I/II/III large subunit